MSWAGYITGGFAVFLMVIFGIAEPNTPYGLELTDGDSGYLTIKGQKVRRIRLHGIDAPEASLECDGRYPGIEATAYAKLRLNGHEVRVTRFYHKDRYGRDIVDLEIWPIGDVASALVSEGHAKLWDYDRGHPKPEHCDA